MGTNTTCYQNRQFPTFHLLSKSIWEFSFPGQAVGVRFSSQQVSASAAPVEEKRNFYSNNRFVYASSLGAACQCRSEVLCLNLECCVETMFKAKSFALVSVMLADS
ncbi:uncharacterized protein LOC141592734 [Silene latifolia]|uniref:uncharacterized protein LOC141592734 n=1 Tax=Silene latifolia TaxID=37657 RepID=UPI003D77777D